MEVQSAVNSHLLIDALTGYGGYHLHYFDQPGADVPGDPASAESTTGFHTGAQNLPYHRPNTSYQIKGGISYLTGAHQFKVGSYEAWQENDTGYFENKYGDYLLTFVNGLPNKITTYNMPVEPVNRQSNQSLYGMDTWALKHVVLNLGVRWERYNGYFPTQSKAAGQFSSAGTFPGADVNIWTDVVPRIGGAWDVRGNGKTVHQGIVRDVR